MDIKEIESKYLDKMGELQLCGDTEIAHSEADKLLHDFLVDIGCGDLAGAYHNVPKWYS